MQNNSHTKQQGPTYIKASAIANIYNVTAPTVYRWAKEGLIPCVRFQDTIRFDLDATREAIEKPLLTSCEKLRKAQSLKSKYGKEVADEGR